MEATRRVACVNASPCIALARLDLVSLLPALFDEVLVTLEVIAELIQGAADDGAWRVSSVERVVVLPGGRLPPLVLPSTLAAGERSVIRVARARSCVALLDDGNARKAAARLGIEVQGTAGLLLAAKSKGLVPAVRPLLATLVATGFRLDPMLMRRFLEQAGE